MIYQKPTKTIAAAYTTTDADNGYRIICNSATAFEITLHTATGKYNYELEIDNIGAGEITVGEQVLKQYTHAHIGNNGGSAWSVVVGGGGDIAFTDLTDAPSSYIGQAGKLMIVTTEEDGLEFADQYSLTGPTETTFGGIKAAEKTASETQEVKYDASTGKLFVIPADAAANGVPAGGTSGQVLTKDTSTDYDCSWVDPTGGSTAAETIWGGM